MAEDAKDSLCLQSRPAPPQNVAELFTPAICTVLQFQGCGGAGCVGLPVPQQCPGTGLGAKSLCHSQTWAEDFLGAGSCSVAADQLLWDVVRSHPHSSIPLLWQIWWSGQGSR